MIGKLLGHRKVQTTARYAHLARESVNVGCEGRGEHYSRYGETRLRFRMICVDLQVSVERANCQRCFYGDYTVRRDRNSQRL